ncbi:MAG TPA: hypothetical protein PL157_23590, partial [Acidobacteriota bacterium]|nr:hypothetical protein [Acidobacteriota bacterium]
PPKPCFIMFKSLVFLLVTTLVLGFNSLCVTAHDFHASFTQLEFNPKTKSVEMTLRVFTDDLTNALSRRTGRHIVLDQTPDAESLTFAYVKDRFELRNERGKALRLTWVGMDVKVDMVWIYIEIPMPLWLKQGQLRNEVLTELFADQVNVVGLKANQHKGDLMFAASDRFKPLPELTPIPK